MAKFRERVEYLKFKGISHHTAVEVAIGEKLLSELLNARTVGELRTVLATVVVKQWGTGRSPDKLGQVYEDQIRRSSKEFPLDKRLDSAELASSPHTLAGHD